MHIRECRAWPEACDQVRGGDKVSPSQSFLHLAEEVGENAREIEYLGGTARCRVSMTPVTGWLKSWRAR